MAQTLRVKVRGADGNEEFRTVKVLRCWQDASGKQVFLHADGTYGYKDGSPIREITDLDVIGNPIQRELAVSWWNRTGKERSKKYYDEINERIRERSGDFDPNAGTADSDLDSILYCRRKIDGSDVSKPFTWLEQFNARPDWWGQANLIEFEDWVYERVKDQDEGPVQEKDERAEDTNPF